MFRTRGDRRDVPQHTVIGQGAQAWRTEPTVGNPQQLSWDDEPANSVKVVIDFLVDQAAQGLSLEAGEIGKASKVLPSKLRGRHGDAGVQRDPMRAFVTIELGETRN